MIPSLRLCPSFCVYNPFSGRLFNGLRLLKFESTHFPLGSDTGLRESKQVDYEPHWRTLGYLDL
jgi:hypothetical protein